MSSAWEHYRIPFPHNHIYFDSLLDPFHAWLTQRIPYLRAFLSRSVSASLNFITLITTWTFLSAHSSIVLWRTVFLTVHSKTTRWAFYAFVFNKLIIPATWQWNPLRTIFTDSWLLGNNIWSKGKKYYSDLAIHGNI